MEIICFFYGIAFAITHSVYPVTGALILLFFRPKRLYCYAFLAGLLYALLHVWWMQDSHMPNGDVIKKATVSGYVASIPTVTDTKTQFQFHLLTLDAKPVHAQVLLSCYQDCPTLNVGEYWQFNVKLKRPRNLGNPGRFDYVNWLKARHIGWTGYVRSHSFKRLDIPNKAYPLLNLRQTLASKLASLSLDKQTLGILQALTLGLGQDIAKDHWELFRRTGTIHLMVISGAHIGLVAGLIFMIVKWLWSLSTRLLFFCPAQRAASIAALMAAGIYTLLAGCGIPAQRAFIVCFFMFARFFSSQSYSIWQAWRYALLAVLIYEPHSVVMPGFYLSFIAVAILLITNQRFSCKGIKKTLLIQFACMIGLMPLTLYWFSYGAVNGVVANLLAIPWVGFIIIPLSLIILSIVYWHAMPLLNTLLEYATSSLLTYLNWVDSLSRLNIDFTFNQILSPLILMLALGLLVCVPSIRLLPLLLMLTIPSLFQAYDQVKLREAKIDVVDVGQGLSVIIRTAQHVLVYDTGVKFYKGTDMGKMALIPYLKTLNTKRIDKVVISHNDLDHRGGLRSLEQFYPVDELIVDRPHFYKRGTSCHHYPSWEWDGVRFEFLPLRTRLKGKNNHSCVLQVKTQSNQMLLTGDIESLAEEHLIKKHAKRLASTVLLVPHHSSKTSSSLAFLNAVSPSYAISSYGFENRYHFPHKTIVARYKQQHIPVYNTADCGMIHIQLRSIENPIITTFNPCGVTSG